MKRILSLLCCVSLILSSLVMFAGCAGKDICETGSVKVDLQDFVLMYADDENISATFRAQAEQLAQRFFAVTGVPVKATAQKNEEDQHKKVILVGACNDGASKRMQRSIKEQGFAIRVQKNKIVIVGSTPVMTMYAMQYLAQNCLNEASENSSVTLPRRIIANRLPTMELASSEGTECSFVYQSSLDTKEGNPWDEPDGSVNYDYPYQALLDCVSNLSKATGLAAKDFIKKADSTKSEAGEIVIGLAKRDEVDECLAELASEGYGVFVRNGKTILTARSDTALSYAHGIFRDLTSDALVTDENGKISVLLPEGLALTGVCFDAYVTEFPKPDGVSLYNMQDAGDKSLQYLYLGDGVNANAFHAYCEKLEGAGYTQLGEQNGIENSLFATYVNEQENTTLYVAYNDFKHGKDSYNYDPRLKVISASLDDVTVADDKILTAPIYKKVTDASITALSMAATAVGMGYVIMLEDGSFIVLDGGRQGDTLERLWNVMLGLYKKAYGKEPTANDPLRISAWIVTHSHSDHYEVFLNFLDTYASKPFVKIDYIFGNFPSRFTAFNAAGKDMSLSNATALTTRAGNDCKYVKIHTGERFYFAGLEIEVLFTQEDANPVRLNLFNDTSAVVRFTMRATDENGNAVTGDQATVTSIWTGDAFVYGSRFMSAMYGTYLESDMVQVAHHGNIGCESHFYRNIKPTAIWFPHTYDSYRNYTRGGVSAWQYKVDYDLVYGIGSVRYAYVSDTYCVTLPLRATGADYAGIFDAITGNTVAYGSNAALAIKQK